MSELNKELLLKWVEALESGKYEKGTGYLRRMDKYCCLGVFCDLVQDELGGKWVIEPIEYDGDAEYDVFEVNGGEYEDVPPFDLVELVYGKQSEEDRMNVWGSTFVPQVSIPPYLRPLKPTSKYFEPILDGPTVYVTELNDYTDITFKEMAQCIRYEYDLGGLWEEVAD